MLPIVTSIFAVAAVLALINMDSIKKALLFILLVVCAIGFMVLCIHYPGATALFTACALFAIIRFGGMR